MTGPSDLRAPHAKDTLYVILLLLPWVLFISMLFWGPAH